MSTSALPDLLHGADLHDRGIELIDYNAHARRLSLRIETRTEGEDGGPLVRTLIFDGVFGLHCEPPNALARLADGEDGEILRLDAKERKTGETEIQLVFIRHNYEAKTRTTQTAMFHTHAARWLG